MFAHLVLVEGYPEPAPTNRGLAVVGALARVLPVGLAALVDV